MLLKINKWIVILIQEVKRRTILYDPNHTSRKNYTTKEKLWQEIAQKLNISVYRAKAKWKSLRDVYIKHLKAISSEELSEKYKSYKRWRWAKYMEFMRPHINGTDKVVYSDHKDTDLTRINVKGERSNDAAYTEVVEFVQIQSDSEDRERELDDSKDHVHEEQCYIDERDRTHDTNNELRRSSCQDDDEVFLSKEIYISRTKNHKQRTLNRFADEGHYYVKNIQNKPKRKQRNNSTCEQERHSDEEEMKRRQRKRVTSNYALDIDNEMQLDAIEHIFLGYAKTIKSLPLKNQIHVKIKIAKLIMEEELKCL